MRRALKDPTTGEPLQILRFNDGKAHVDTENLRTILTKAGNRKIVVISINGPTRTGKSYVLSNFIRFTCADGVGSPGVAWFHQSDGIQARFRWKGGTTRTTTGIDMWSEPLTAKVGGENVALLLMDTQGSFDQKTSMQENSIVFAVSAMLSSVFIYNCSKSLPESDFQFLHFFTDFSQRVNPSAGCLAQKLVFLVRDFQDTSEFPFGYYSNTECPQEGGGNYFLEKVMDNPGQNEEVQATHESIMKSFQDVGCFLLPEPSKQLKRHDDEKDMDEEFLQFLDVFIRKMLREDQLKPKTVSGAEVTAVNFISFAEKWAECIDGDHVPSVSTIFAMTIKAQKEVASIEALKFYNTSMQAELKRPGGQSLSFLQLKHEQFVEEALTVYKNHAKLCPGDLQAKKQLKAEMERTFSEIKTIDALAKLESQQTELRNLENVSRKYAECIIDANNTLREQMTDRNCVILFVNRTELAIEVPEVTMIHGTVKQRISKIEPYAGFNVTAVKNWGAFGVSGVYKMFFPTLNKTLRFMFAVPMFDKNRFALATTSSVHDRHPGKRHFWTLYRDKNCDADGNLINDGLLILGTLAHYEDKVRKVVKRGQSDVGEVALGDIRIKVTMRSSFKAMFTVEFSKEFPGIFADDAISVKSKSQSEVSSDEEDFSGSPLTPPLATIAGDKDVSPTLLGAKRGVKFPLAANDIGVPTNFQHVSHIGVNRSFGFDVDGKVTGLYPSIEAELSESKMANASDSHVECPKQIPLLPRNPPPRLNRSVTMKGEEEVVNHLPDTPTPTAKPRPDLHNGQTNPTDKASKAFK